MYITLTYTFGGEKYDYEISLSHQIALEYFEHLVGDYSFKSWNENRQQGFVRCFDLLWQEDVFNIDYFIYNEDFLIWLSDREKDNAKKEWENQL